MVFFFLLGCFFLEAGGFELSFFLKGLGGLGGLLMFFWAFFFWTLLQPVEGASTFVMPNVSQKVLISFWDCALSDPYLAWSLISLQRFRPSVLTIPKIYPKVSKLNEISFVPKFWCNLLRIRSLKSFGNPAKNLSFQKSWVLSSLLRAFVRKTTSCHL